jgi:hypothetical protein
MCLGTTWTIETRSLDMIDAVGIWSGAGLTVGVVFMWS